METASQYLFEPTLPQKTRSTNATQDVEFEERKTRLKPLLIYDELYGRVLTPPPRLAAAHGR
ncbi:hypothetical protein ANO14919_056060 [Xylariales sp. No.14919]|nr:hypothetical protein ANO14919_056060 [Xylariales sp. No.14919]